MNISRRGYDMGRRIHGTARRWATAIPAAHRPSCCKVIKATTRRANRGARAALVCALVALRFVSAVAEAQSPRNARPSKTAVSTTHRAEVAQAHANGGQADHAIDASPRVLPKNKRLHTTRRVRSVAQLADPAKLQSLPNMTPITVRIDDGQVRAAGTSITATVYENTDPAPFPWRPGTGMRMADDLTLAGGGCDTVEYSLAVACFPLPESGLTTCPTFSVQTALWTGDPCVFGSTIIAGTSRNTIGLAGNAQISFLTFAVDPAAPLPDTVWMSAEFTTDTSGWLLARESEIGSTQNVFSQGNNAATCGEFFFGPGGPHAGFWAAIECVVSASDTGACCDGVSCTEVIEADCVVGTWLGAFTTCDPNPCQPGACCSGVGFTTCTDTTEAGCNGQRDLFHPDQTCDQSPCPQTFEVYASHFNTGIFATIDTQTRWADKITLGPGAPCDLAAFTIRVVGDEVGAPFDVHLEVLGNNDNGTPLNPDDDLPDDSVVIATAEFFGIPSDFLAHELLAGPFDMATLPETLWIAVATSTPDSGVLLTGDAELGFSEHTMAVFNDPLFQLGEWVGGINFGPVNFAECPFDGFNNCNAAATFDIGIYCIGQDPVGACCNEAVGTCVDSVRNDQCDGRWAQDKTCDDPTAFTPACGVNACCLGFPVTGCFDRPTQECITGGGVPKIGFTCAEKDFGFTCPRGDCFNRPGDCETVHASLGCDDVECCDIVCTNDDLCCTDVTINWDTACAMDAISMCPASPPINDHCEEAAPVSVGTQTFDMSLADTDGAPHDGCSVLARDEQINNDLWYCYTATCTGTSTAETCGLTSVDTRIAVYEGCDVCPPTDAELVACDDDDCSSQSRAPFLTVAGQKYLVRAGVFPGSATQDPAEPSIGQLRFSCAQTLCPPGAVTFLNPPDGIVDARPSGFDVFEVQGPPGAFSTCWSLCETPADAPANGIIEVVEIAGRYFITLLGPTQPGRVTTITYTDDLGNTTTGEFTMHPGNVDGSAFADGDDVTAMRDCLSGTETCDVWECDVDGNGQCTPVDILNLIDRLNGALGDPSTLGTPLPINGGGCP